MWFWPKKENKGNTQGRLSPPGMGRRQGAAATRQKDKASRQDGGATGLTAEVAAASREAGGAGLAWGAGTGERDPLLGSGMHGEGIPAPDSAYAYPYGLFEEALDKDAHLSALVGQRKAAVLAWERGLVPGDASPAAQAAWELVELGLGNIGSSGAGLRARQASPGQDAGRDARATGTLENCGLDRDLWELLDALPYGLAVSEVVWEWVEIGASNQLSVISDQSEPGASEQSAVSSEQAKPKQDSPSSLITDHCSLITDASRRVLRPGKYLLPKALLSRHPRRFVFSPSGELRLLTDAEPLEGEAVPPRKFIVFAPYGRHENPYGTPLLRSVWWPSYLKRQALKFWLLHCEKYGMPTAVLQHPASATQRERSSYRSVVQSIQQLAGIVLPEGVELSLLEAGRGGGAASYQGLIELCNAEMSKALVGQTLTVDTPAGGAGSYAMARVHQAVREDLTRLDAQALMGCINGTLVRWIVELNLGNREQLAGNSGSRESGTVPCSLAPVPSWTLTPPRQADLRLQLEIDRFFAEQGLAVDSSETYARYGRKRGAGLNAEDAESAERAEK